MEYTLSSMDIGIIIVDAEGRILFTNTSSLKMFNFDSGENDILDKKVIELVKDAKLNNLIKDCIENGNSSEFETEVNDEKVAKILIRRINNNSKASTSGCLVIIYDITHVKKLEQMSSDFVSNVSHEIKTPLTSIKGFVETLKEGAIEDDGVAYKFLDIIEL